MWVPVDKQRAIENNTKRTYKKKTELIFHFIGRAGELIAPERDQRVVK